METTNIATQLASTNLDLEQLKQMDPNQLDDHGFLLLVRCLATPPTGNQANKSFCKEAFKLAN